MFADLAGSTAYKSERELVSSLLKVYIHNMEIQDRVRKHNGTVIKNLGDGILATFTIEESSDISFPLDAAARIQRTFFNYNAGLTDSERIRSRIGLACGVVIDFTSINPSGESINDPQGPVVDLAARLCSLAHPEQVLCDSSIYMLAEESVHKYDFSVAASRHLKGFHESVSIYALHWGSGSKLDIQYPDPTHGNQGFLTTEFVLGKAQKARGFIRVVGHSHRHYCDNAELYNVVATRRSENPDYVLELVFLNPNSEFTSYAQATTRREVADLRSAVLQNIRTAAAFYCDLGGAVRLVVADYPMAIPVVQCDDEVFFSLPFRAAREPGRRVGVVDGPYLQVHRDTPIGRRVIRTVEGDHRIEIPMAEIAAGESDLEAILAL
jgi:class 3 adenylate cyclase